MATALLCPGRFAPIDPCALQAAEVVEVALLASNTAALAAGVSVTQALSCSDVLCIVPTGKTRNQVLDDLRACMVTFSEIKTWPPA